MADNEQPLDDTELAEIGERLKRSQATYTMYADEDNRYFSLSDGARLFAEAKRLRAQVADLSTIAAKQQMVVISQRQDISDLQAENAAMRTIVEAVAELGPGLYGQCRFCGYTEHQPGDDPCLGEQARAFVAAHPATGEGE